MDTSRILAELRAERDRMDRAISALENLNSTGRGAAAREPRATPEKKRGRMSAAARRKLSRLLKQRWAQGKMKPKSKAKAA
jgi:hypothetical protein